MSFVVKVFDFNPSDTKAQKKSAPHTPAGFLQALIKIYVSPCNLPNLFSCQISSSLTCVSYPAYAGMSLTNPGVCKLPSSSNPMFDANPAITGSRKLKSNIELEFGSGGLSNLDADPSTPSQNLVELTGIEPVASWLQTRRSPS